MNDPRTQAKALETILQANHPDTLVRSAHDVVIVCDGEADIRALIDSGMFDDDLEGMSEHDIDRLIQTTAESADWTLIRDSCIATANQFLIGLIQTELYQSK